MQNYPEYLHLVAFDIPFPANYGGVIDIYYKLEALHKEGVKVILHCYQYRKKESSELESICHQVNYYPRKTFKNPFYGKLPYIVNSRNSSELLNNLLKDDAPILFEGLHCTYYLDHPALAKRFKVVRMHNIEHHYYRHLERAEHKYFKKYFFRVEADKLKKHQQVLHHADLIAAISPNDTKYLSKRFDNVHYVPAFHPNKDPKYAGGNGDFILYHGNLGVAENYEAAIKLTKEVFSKLRFRCVIAGNNAPNELHQLVELYPNVELITGVSTERIHELISEAHINVLYTDQATGIKLKLLNALYRGKHLLANPLISENTQLEELCKVEESLVDFKAVIEELMHKDYPYKEFEGRLDVLEELFSNSKSAQKLLEAMVSTPKKQVITQKPNKRSLTQITTFISYFLG